MKKAQIKRSWIVYKPNYDNRVDYPIYVPFLKDAWNKACSFGVGAEVWLSVDKYRRNGSSCHISGEIVYVVEKTKKHRMV